MKKRSMPYVCMVIIRGHKLLRPCKMHKYVLKTATEISRSVKVLINAAGHVRFATALH
jgi:hypothetical protein